MDAYTPSRTTFCTVTLRGPAASVANLATIRVLLAEGPGEVYYIAGPMPFDAGDDELQGFEVAETILDGWAYTRSSPWELTDDGFRCWVEFDAGDAAEKLVRELTLIDLLAVNAGGES